MAEQNQRILCKNLNLCSPNEELRGYTGALFDSRCKKAATDPLHESCNKKPGRPMSTGLTGLIGTSLFAPKVFGWGA